VVGLEQESQGDEAEEPHQARLDVRDAAEDGQDPPRPAAGFGRGTHSEPRANRARAVPVSSARRAASAAAPGDAKRPRVGRIVAAASTRLSRVGPGAPESAASPAAAAGAARCVATDSSSSGRSGAGTARTSHVTPAATGSVRPLSSGPSPRESVYGAGAFSGGTTPPSTPRTTSAEA